MTDATPGDDVIHGPRTAGERLREAREQQGLSLAEVASRTRVPVRHLEAIEASDYRTLPSVTYSIGFAKAYARAVGIDEVAIGREVRAQSDKTVQRTEYVAYEIDEPARVPSRGLAMAGLIAAIIVLIGIGLWYGTGLFRHQDGAPATTAAVTVPVAAPAAAPAPVPAVGHVTLTATDDVWMKVYDATGKTLYLGTLKPGERYDVPTDAQRPMINVGRPDQLTVTLNGSAVPPLGDGKRAIKDVGVSAQAIAARTAGTATQPAPSQPSAQSTDAPPPAFAQPDPASGAPSSNP